MEIRKIRRRRRRHDGQRHRAGRGAVGLRRRPGRHRRRRRCDKGSPAIDKSLDRLVAKGKLDAGGARRGAGAGSRSAGELDALAGCRPRRRGGGRAVRGQAPGPRRRSTRLLAARAILATNTSSISITRLAAATRAPGQGHRHALHEPGAGHAAGRDHPRPADLAGDLRRRRARRRAQLGQDAGRGATTRPASSRTAC